MKRMNIITTFLLSVIIVLGYMLPHQSMVTMVFATGTPDSYGNRILSLSIQQWNGSAYVWIEHEITWDGSNTFDGWWINFTSNPVRYTYTDGVQLKVEDSKPTKFWIFTCLNKTLANDGDDAVTLVRAYINITSETYSLTNQQFTIVKYGGEGSTNYYWQKNYYVWNVTGHPQATVSYDVTIKYQAYY